MSLVMLAHTYKEGQILKGSWAYQPKFDGVRAIWNPQRGYFISRTGKKLVVPDLTEYMLQRYKNSLHIFDGELLVSGESFNSAAGKIRRTININDKNVYYVIFDIIDSSKTFEARNDILQSIIPSQRVFSYPAKTLENLSLDSVEEILSYHIANGFEGSILRDTNSLYEFKRSKGLLKNKAWLKDSFPVISIEEGKGKCSGMMGNVTCYVPNGGDFSVGTGFSDAQRKEIFLHKPTEITVKFQEFSEYGIPRFPVALSWK